METMVINVPENKRDLVKQILEGLGLGVTIQNTENVNASEFKKSLAKISVWLDEDIKPIEDARKAFDSLKPIE